jgi:hypothetical protein
MFLPYTRGTAAVHRLKGDFVLTWVSKKFSEVVNVFSEQCRDGQDVSLRTLLLDVQGRQLSTAQVLECGSENKRLT